MADEPHRYCQCSGCVANKREDRRFAAATKALQGYNANAALCDTWPSLHTERAVKIEAALLDADALLAALDGEAQT